MGGTPQQGGGSFFSPARSRWSPMAKNANGAKIKRHPTVVADVEVASSKGSRKPRQANKLISPRSGSLSAAKSSAATHPTSSAPPTTPTSPKKPARSVGTGMNDERPWDFGSGGWGNSMYRRRVEPDKRVLLGVLCRRQLTVFARRSSADRLHRSRYNKTHLTSSRRQPRRDRRDASERVQVAHERGLGVGRGWRCSPNLVDLVEAVALQIPILSRRVMRSIGTITRREQRAESPIGGLSSRERVFMPEPWGAFLVWPNVIAAPPRLMAGLAHDVVGPTRRIRGVCDVVVSKGLCHWRRGDQFRASQRTSPTPASIILLDIVPPKPTEKDDTSSKAFRADRFALSGKDAILKSKPSLLFTKRDADFIEVGNLDDDLGRAAECDLVIEVVLEHLDVEQKLFPPRWSGEARHDRHLEHSGLSIAGMVDGRSDAFKKPTVTASTRSAVCRSLES
jgi:hypothetical protein